MTTETQMRTQTGVTEDRSFLEEIVQGLRRPLPHLPCKFFYDKRGSELFDQICELDEYYLTRTELSIMEDYAANIAERLGPGCVLIELGSGSSVKIRLLLDQMPDLTAYVPVDISLEHLQEAADEIAADYPNLEVEPLCADFTKRFVMPERHHPKPRRVIYFPGSTLGNFHRAEAAELLANMRDVVGPSGALVVGIDLKKSTTLLNAAYNDSEGVTAEFNKNILVRMRDELDIEIDPDDFQHEAIYNPKKDALKSTYAA